jgi:Muniscin C-terminal mu homology domain
MQLLNSSTIPVVEFASVSLLLYENSGERIVTASPLSTTPFASLALDELDDYLRHVHRASQQQQQQGGGDGPSSSCADQLVADDMRLSTSPQIYRSEYSGLALYYWMVRDKDFSHNAFSALMGSKGSRFTSEKVVGVVLCVGVSGGGHPSSPLVRTLTARLQDAVNIMMRLAGDAEECKNSYKALLATFLMTEDEDRRTNAMVDSEQVSMELELDTNDDEGSSRKFGIKSKSKLGIKRGTSVDLMNATFESVSSADKARLLEKRSAILSVVEKDCTLRKYELRNKAVEGSATKSRRRKNKGEDVLKDFDFTTPKQAKSIVAEVAAAAARSRPATPVTQKPTLQKPQKDTAPKKLPFRSPSASILAPPRAGASSSRRSSYQAASSKKKASQPQAAFNAFDMGAEENDSNINGTFIAFPGLDESNNGNKTDQSRREKYQESTMNSASDNFLTQSYYTNKSGQSSSFDPFLVDDSHSVSSATKSRTPDDLYYSNGSESMGLQEDDSQSLKSRENSTDGLNRIQVNVALNEDLTCSYKQSKISSCMIEGVVQVQVKSDFKEETPFVLLMRDPSRHIRMIQENRRYASDKTEQLSETHEEDTGVDYKFEISVPKAENYFPVMRYKCSPELRPVPIRVQTRVRVSQGFCRVALQISSNPANEDDLTDLTIIMGVPLEVRGESLITSPPGGVWNAAKRSVIWCVAELGDGEKFQLQAQFEVLDEKRAEVENERPKFPVLVRCQCMYAQLSDIELEVRDVPDVFPAEVAMKLARRFRLSHRERS